MRRNQVICKICVALFVLLIGIGAALGGWRDAQHKFRDVTVPAGEDTALQLEQFFTEYTVAEKAAFVTDISAIDCNMVGTYPVTLRYGQREETVTLTVQDVQAPVLKVQDLEVFADQLPAAGEFVAELWDHSEVTVSLEEPIVIPDDYSDVTVAVVAVDAAGNQSQAQCTLSFLWMRQQVCLEYGDTLDYEDVLCDPEKDAGMIRAGALYTINQSPAGTYSISSISGGKRAECVVVVQDTTAPVLKLKTHKAYPYSQVTVRNFVQSATDLSGDVTLTMLTQPDTSVLGEHVVEIEAVDIYGNKTVAQTALRISNDITPPTIYGASGAITVEKYSDPDYLAGVYAYDYQNGRVEVSVDSGMVNTSAGGTYFVTYTATDNSGNVATLRRRVKVTHDEEDTKALVKEIAAKLPEDPELIRDYVRNTIPYSADWGGADPIWRGFTEKHGNCYVHAMCLQALLTEKGYNTQLIWTTQRTHYWLIIELEPGFWRHIDATPGTRHTKYSLMDDGQRLATLSGRYWYFSEWPACE